MLGNSCVWRFVIFTFVKQLAAWTFTQLWNMCNCYVWYLINPFDTLPKGYEIRAVFNFTITNVLKLTEYELFYSFFMIR